MKKKLQNGHSPICEESLALSTSYKPLPLSSLIHFPLISHMVVFYNKKFHSLNYLSPEFEDVFIYIFWPSFYFDGVSLIIQILFLSFTKRPDLILFISIYFLIVGVCWVSKSHYCTLEWEWKKERGRLDYQNIKSIDVKSFGRFETSKQCFWIDW